MMQRVYRILFLLFIAAGAVRLSAQTGSSEAGVWIVYPQLAESSVVMSDGDSIASGFDEQTGYGISFNHFWTERFSTELAMQKFGGDLIIHTDTITADMAVTVGDLDARSITAMGQFHFRRATRFAPYLAAGLARLWGEFDADTGLAEPGDDQTVDLEPELTWAAAAGANVRLTERIYFVGEMKYIPWEAIAEGEPTDEEVDVHPITFAAGVKVRF